MSLSNKNILIFKHQLDIQQRFLQVCKLPFAAVHIHRSCWLTSKLTHFIIALLIIKRLLINQGILVYQEIKALMSSTLSHFITYKLLNDLRVSLCSRNGSFFVCDRPPVCDHYLASGLVVKLCCLDGSRYQPILWNNACSLPKEVTMSRDNARNL